MTLEFLLSRLAKELKRSAGPVDLKHFTESFYPHDGKAASLLMEAFGAHLLRGRATFDTFFRVTGHVIAIRTGA